MAKPIEQSIRESPSGGSRIAWSYLVFVVGVAIGGIVLAASSPVIEAACRAETVFCDIGWMTVVSLLGLLTAVGIGARLSGLGWEWCIVLATVLLAAPVLSSLFQPLLWIVIVAAPAAAAVFTPPGAPRLRLVAAVFAAVLAISALAVWLLV